MLGINGSVMWTLPLVEPTHQANIAIFKDRFPNGPTTGAAVGAIFVGAAHNVAVESLP